MDCGGLVTVEACNCGLWRAWNSGRLGTVEVLELWRSWNCGGLVTVDCRGLVTVEAWNSGGLVTGEGL